MARTSAPEARQAEGTRPWRLVRLAALAVLAALLVLVTTRRERLGARPVPERLQADGAPPGSDPDARRIAALESIFAEVQSTWRRQLPQVGQTYREARLVLNRETAAVPCSIDGPGADPSYCAETGVVVLDLDDRALAGSRGAQAFAVAHGVGHHVAALLHARGELVADCLAGAWAATTSRVDLRLPADSVDVLLVTLEPTREAAAPRIRAFHLGLASGDALTCTDARTGLSD